MSLLPVPTQLRRRNRDYDNFTRQIKEAQEQTKEARLKSAILAKVAHELTQGKELGSLLRIVVELYGRKMADEIATMVRADNPWPEKTTSKGKRPLHPHLLP